jgi:hypothetical protein
MKRFAEDMEAWNLYDDAKHKLGEYIAKQCNGHYSQVFRRVYHDKKITKSAQERIKGFADALSQTKYGAK